MTQDEVRLLNQMVESIGILQGTIKALTAHIGAQQEVIRSLAESVSQSLDDEPSDSATPRSLRFQQSFETLKQERLTQYYIDLDKSDPGLSAKLDESFEKNPGKKWFP